MLGWADGTQTYSTESPQNHYIVKMFVTELYIENCLFAGKNKFEKVRKCSRKCLWPWM
jgi:hypothetical protein